MQLIQLITCQFLIQFITCQFLIQEINANLEFRLAVAGSSPILNLAELMLYQFYN
jgi:hypothetical protein